MGPVCGKFWRPLGPLIPKGLQPELIADFGGFLIHRTVCAYVDMYVCGNVCLYTYIYLCIYIYIQNVYVHIHVKLHVCVYI